MITYEEKCLNETIPLGVMDDLVEMIESSKIYSYNILDSWSEIAANQMARWQRYIINRNWKRRQYGV